MVLISFLRMEMVRSLIIARHCPGKIGLDARLIPGAKKNLRSIDLPFRADLCCPLPLETMP